MGLLDNIIGAISGGGKDNNMMDAIGGLIGGGGLNGLIENFTKGGLGDMIGSWVGTGKNLPISAEQLQSVLGSEQVKAIAGKLGISPEEASNKLASVLPDVVDKLTPEGKLPDVEQMAGGLGGLLKGLKL